jgi:glycosyltransferase involved in cell wall biosynthesis
MKISVCMATYNGAEYIRQQLETILPQLNANDEVIVSDDSSSDNTLEIVKSFYDSRIIIYSGNHFRSPVFNFENAIQKATGEIIFLSDQDDIWTENKVKVMMAALTTCDLVVSDCYITDKDLHVIVPSMFSINKSAPGLIRNTVKNAYLGCCMAFHRKILEKCLPFPKDIPMHDIWIGMVADAFYKTGFIDDKLVYYRRHGGNSVQWKGKPVSVYGMGRKLQFRWVIIKNLFLLKLKKTKQ